MRRRLLSLYIPLAHLGLIIVPTGYADRAMFKAGTPYGATAVSVNPARPPTEDDLAVARWQGRRVTLVAKRSNRPGYRRSVMAAPNAASRAYILVWIDRGVGWRSACSKA